MEISQQLQQTHNPDSTPTRRLSLQRPRSVACALAAGLLIASAIACAQPRSDAPGTTIRYVKGRLLVQPRAGLSEKELDRLLQPHGGKRATQIKQIDVHVIELPEQANEIAVMHALQKSPHIQFAELDIALEPLFVTTDPNLGSQWHHSRIGSQLAWDSSTGQGITIAVLDTGVDASHPDLQAGLVPGWNTYEDSNNTADVHGHGTMTAGSAAAVGNNAVGIAGVAWKSKIMPVRITDPDGYGYYSTMAKGLTWAADHGARIASISFANTCGSATVANAAQYMRNRGGVVTIAAGNSGGLIGDAPSGAITCVSATDSSDARAGFSSFGDAVDVGAPGVSIMTTTRGGGYATASGTSFAAPVTAGVYALMLGTNNALSPSALDSALFASAKDLGASGWDQSFGNGRVDAAAAVARAQAATQPDTQPPAVSITSPVAGSKVGGLVPVSVTATDNQGVMQVDLYAGGTLIGTDLLAPFQFTWDTSAYPDGTAMLVAKAADGTGNLGTSPSVGVTVANDTIAPTVTITNPQAGSTVSGVVNVTVTASDNVKVSRLVLSIDGREVAQVFGASLSYSWDTKAGTGPKRKGKSRKSTSPTTSSISARAEDPAANVGTASVTVLR